MSNKMVRLQSIKAAANAMVRVVGQVENHQICIPKTLTHLASRASSKAVASTTIMAMKQWSVFYK